MGKFRMLVACLPFLTLPVAAGTWVYDAGPRATIYDDNFKMGLGGEFGAINALNSDWDYGAHLNYTYFRPKTTTWTSAQEFGGYGTLYYLPKLDQPYSLRLGPHFGFSYIRDFYLDVGGDLMAYFPVQAQTQFYVAFIPAFFIGKHSQALVRVGIGLEYHPGL
jgi:hypothetical protein